MTCLESSGITLYLLYFAEINSGSNISNIWDGSCYNISPVFQWAGSGWNGAATRTRFNLWIRRPSIGITYQKSETDTKRRFRRFCWCFRARNTKSNYKFDPIRNCSSGRKSSPSNCLIIYFNIATVEKQTFYLLFAILAPEKQQQIV